MKRQHHDEGLAQIDDFEQRLLLAYEEKRVNGISAEELARFRPAAIAEAKAICDRLRAEYKARRP